MFLVCWLKASAVLPFKYLHKCMLTGVYLLELDVSLQPLSQTLLAAMFPQCSIIHQQEVGMETIKAGSLA